MTKTTKLASADLQWMDYCARKKATRVNLLGNKLVLIAAKMPRLTTSLSDRALILPNLPEMVV